MRRSLHAGMIRSNRYYSAIATLLLFWAGAAAARPPPARIAALQRGINITHWFRFPPSVSPAALTNYLSDRDLERLRQAAFTFLRIPIEPQIARAAPDALCCRPSVNDSNDFVATSIIKILSK